MLNALECTLPRVHRPHPAPYQSLNPDLTTKHRPSAAVTAMSRSVAHVRGGLVENEDAGVLQQRAGHAQQLPLASAQVGAALYQLRVEAALSGP